MVGGSGGGGQGRRSSRGGVDTQGVQGVSPRVQKFAVLQLTLRGFRAFNRRCQTVHSSGTPQNLDL